MFGILNFGAFIIAGIILNLTPGTDTVYILGKSLSKGKRDGILAALGIGTGSLVHTVFATFGLSAILAESAMAFNIVKYLGAGYLIYLGIKSIINRENLGFHIQKDTNRLKKNNTFISAILTNILNPKVALFYLAFLPQFVDPAYTNPVFSFLLLGGTFTLTGTIWCLLLANYSARLSNSIQANYRFKSWFDKITGGLFIALGVKLALSGK